MITIFSNRKENFDYDKAIIEWKEDLVYLEKKWEYIK